MRNVWAEMFGWLWLWLPLQFTLWLRERNWTQSCLIKKKVNLYIVLDWLKSAAQARKRDVSVNLTAMLRIPNYAIISHTKDSQQHRNWPLFHSVPADAVWIKQQHVCSHTALTVWRHRSSVLLSVSVVFVNWCFFLFCEYDHFFFLCVSLGAKGQQFWRNHLGS